MRAFSLVLSKWLQLIVGTACAGLRVCMEEGQLVNHTSRRIALVTCWALAIWWDRSVAWIVAVGLADAATESTATCTEAHAAEGFEAFLGTLLIGERTLVLKVGVARSICPLLHKIVSKLFSVYVNIS